MTGASGAPEVDDPIQSNRERKKCVHARGAKPRENAFQSIQSSRGACRAPGGECSGADVTAESRRSMIRGDENFIGKSCFSTRLAPL